VNQETAQYVDIGTRIGRGQAFGMIANQSLAAQAACLRQIQHDQEYKTLDLTWEEFCEQFIGMSRKHVDDLIRNLDEFGAAYFRLSEIIRISPATYRQIEDKVDGDEIEIDGKMVLISAENAPRIRLGVQRLRAQLAEAKHRFLPAICRVSTINRLTDEAVAELTRLSELDLASDEKAALTGITDYAIRRLTKVSQRLQKAA
jgi:hypothetical protein